MKGFVFASLLLALTGAVHAKEPAKIGEACVIGVQSPQFGADVTGHMLKCDPRTLKWEEMGNQAQDSRVYNELVKLNTTNEQILAQQVESNNIQKQILTAILAGQSQKK